MKKPVGAPLLASAAPRPTFLRRPAEHAEDVFGRGNGVLGQVGVELRVDVPPGAGRNLVLVALEVLRRDVPADLGDGDVTDVVHLKNVSELFGKNN